MPTPPLEPRQSLSRCLLSSWGRGSHFQLFSFSAFRPPCLHPALSSIARRAAEDHPVEKTTSPRSGQTKTFQVHPIYSVHQVHSACRAVLSRHSPATGGTTAEAMPRRVHPVHPVENQEQSTKSPPSAPRLFEQKNAGRALKP